MVLDMRYGEAMMTMIGPAKLERKVRIGTAGTEYDETPLKAFERSTLLLCYERGLSRRKKDVEPTLPVSLSLRKQRTTPSPKRCFAKS